MAVVTRCGVFWCWKALLLVQKVKLGDLCFCLGELPVFHFLPLVHLLVSFRISSSVTPSPGSSKALLWEFVATS